MSAHSVLRQAPSKNVAGLSESPGASAGHLDRVVPLKVLFAPACCFPGNARVWNRWRPALGPDKRAPRPPSPLHHVVAHAPWRDEDILEALAASTPYPPCRSQDRSKPGSYRFDILGSTMDRTGPLFRLWRLIHRLGVRGARRRIRKFASSGFHYTGRGIDVAPFLENH